MKKILIKLMALLLLGIYAVNPVHALLHTGHNHGPQTTCHEECHDEADHTISAKKASCQHECYLCQHSVDRVYVQNDLPEPESKDHCSFYTISSFYKTQVDIHNYFFVELRGPPSLA